jgi:hypothetical protein
MKINAFGMSSSMESILSTRRSFSMGDLSSHITRRAMMKTGGEPSVLWVIGSIS